MLMALAVGLAFLSIKISSLKLLIVLPICPLKISVIAIGSSARPFVRACVYQPPGSCLMHSSTNFSISSSTCLQLVPHFLCLMISAFMLIQLPMIVLNFS